MLTQVTTRIQLLLPDIFPHTASTHAVVISLHQSTDNYITHNSLYTEYPNRLFDVCRGGKKRGEKIN